HTSGKEIPFYRDERYLRAAAQIISAALIIGAIIWVIVNFLEGAAARQLNLTFNFLKDPAGFPISDPGIPYDPSMSYGRAFMVGLVNTLRVAVLGIFFAVTIGTLVALSRLSSNWLLSRLALAYIEFHRNIPLLVLIFLWYSTVFTEFPSVQEAIELPGPTYLSQRGTFITWPRLTETGRPFLYATLLGILAAYFAFKTLRRKRAETGQETYYFPISMALLIILPTAGWFISGGEPIWWDIPEFVGRNFAGGLKLTPEFGGLFVALIMYTSGFIAEVVRAGIQAVSRGQFEAAQAIGLKPTQVLSLVVLPQAMRVIIPPLISQFLNLTKNTSLALGVGYQDVFSVGKIAINQSGRAIPAFAIVMSIYLILSLLTSFVLNLYNRRIQFVTR
ncbi:MAG: ABC transporter permease subunit, partial [Anaerolineae bacterium]|nr:ABC transporter permease subunit [Anaerolineae bacterium]